jgi:hypothetical protein
MRHRSFGKQRKGFLGAGLPITAVDEQQCRRSFGDIEEVNSVALARPISEIEVAGMAHPHLGRAPVPAGDKLGTGRHMNAIVETEVAILLAHATPVRRIERCRHDQVSSRAAWLQRVLPLLRKMFYSTTQSVRSRRNDREKSNWPIRDW